MPQRSVYEWIEKLKNGRTNAAHDKGAGRPSMVITEDNTERVCDMVLLDNRVTIVEVAHVLQISHGSANEMMHNKLGFLKICARGSQNKSQRCINKCAWTSIKNIWIALVTNETSS